MKLADLLKAQAAKAAEAPAGPAVEALAVRPDAGRQLGDADLDQPGVIPMAWPVDPPAADVSALCVVIDDAGRGWLSIQRPGAPLLHILGPLPALTIPF